MELAVWVGMRSAERTGGGAADQLAIVNSQSCHVGYKCSCSNEEICITYARSGKIPDKHAYHYSSTSSSANSFGLMRPQLCLMFATICLRMMVVCEAKQRYICGFFYTLQAQFVLCN